MHYNGSSTSKIFNLFHTNKYRLICIINIFHNYQTLEMVNSVLLIHIYNGSKIVTLKVNVEFVNLH